MPKQVINECFFAARKILEEIDRRGFTTDAPDGAIGLLETVANIIQETIDFEVEYEQTIR